jgi:hypothetical protein
MQGSPREGKINKPIRDSKHFQLRDAEGREEHIVEIPGMGFMMEVDRLSMRTIGKKLRFPWGLGSRRLASSGQQRTAHERSHNNVVDR